MDHQARQQEDGPNEWDVDFALGDMDYAETRSTMSLTSSVLAYREENGRRYHAFRDGQYFMPNDSLEQQGMDLMHHLSLLNLQGCLFRAPIINPQSVLEIGTGTGIWAIEMADQFPAATVIATDLSPIQPSCIPPNLEFQIDDCESPWDFNTKFDFIHIRNLSGSIADWPQLLKNCYDYLRPGGWLEVSNIEVRVQSYNGSLSERTSSTAYWQDNLSQAASIAGRELNVAPFMAKLQTAAGFVNVSNDKYMWPISPWLTGKKKFSRMFGYLMDIELEASSLRLYTQRLQRSPDEVHALLAGVRKEINNVDLQAYSNMHYVCGKKLDTA